METIMRNVKTGEVSVLNNVTAQSSGSAQAAGRAQGSGSAEEPATRAIIEQAGVILYGRRNDIPPSFVAQLFGRVVADDVVQYGAEDLAGLAERAFDLSLIHI